MHQRLAMPWAIRIQVCGPDYTRPKARSGPAASKTEASCVGGAVTSPEATTAGGMARTQPWLARELNSPGRSSSPPRGPDVDVSPAASTSADAWLERHGNRLDLSSPAFYVRPLLFSPISLLPLPCSFQCVFPVRWRRRFSRHQSPIIAAPATSPRPSRDFASRRPMNGFAACKFISQVPCRVGQIQRPYSVLPLLPFYFLGGEKKPSQTGNVCKLRELVRSAAAASGLLPKF
jgi:hypothetical protein